MNVFKLHLCVFISINAFCQVIAETQGKELDRAPIDTNINVDIPFQEVVLPPEQEETEYWKQEIQRLLENWPSNSNCEKCGKSSVDVYGRLKRTEEVIPLFKYPWIVAFLRNGEIICSGTLISQNFVLTVADCIFKPESANDKKCQRTFIPQNCFYTPQELSMIFVGDKFLEKPVKIKRFKPHDRYNYWKKTNNLALIELEEPLKCSPMTSPICLPFNMKELKFDNKLSIAGWGSNAFAGYSRFYKDEYQILREGDIEKLDTSKCNNSAVPKAFHGQYLCAFSKFQQACHVDIGGSAFARSGKSFYAIGLVSHTSIPKIRPKQPITLTNVNHFAGFIRHFVRKFPEPWSK